jgi:hypothetical protein
MWKSIAFGTDNLKFELQQLGVFRGRETLLRDRRAKQDVNGLFKVKSQVAKGAEFKDSYRSIYYT